MWMTSSSRADTGWKSILLFVVLVGFAASAMSQKRSLNTTPVPPDAPRAARPQPEQRALPTNYEVKRAVELRSVTVGHVTKEMESLAGPGFLQTAKDPHFIEVKTAPGVLGKPTVAAAPLIVLNGERLVSTRGAGPDTLVAFLPDGEKIKETNAVAVVWIGKQEDTMTKRPLTFRRADVKK